MPLTGPAGGLAAKHSISHQTVAEIWTAFGLKPWRQDSFKVSPDPDLMDKVRDLVGLYMGPPVAAAVFAVDEKPQIQAINRTAPALPMLPTTPARATHDYERNGTCDLFAPLDMASGKVTTDIRAARDNFIAFLGLIDRNVPAELDVQVILDESRSWIIQTLPDLSGEIVVDEGFLRVAAGLGRDNHRGSRNARKLSEPVAAGLGPGGRRPRRALVLLSVMSPWR